MPANEMDDEILNDPVYQASLRAPFCYGWAKYKGDTKFVMVNHERFLKAKKLMVDLHYCATVALNRIVERTVQYDRSKFTESHLEPIKP